MFKTDALFKSDESLWLRFFCIWRNLSWLSEIFDFDGDPLFILMDLEASLATFELGSIPDAKNIEFWLLIFCMILLFSFFFISFCSYFWRYSKSTWNLYRYPSLSPNEQHMALRFFHIWTKIATESIIWLSFIIIWVIS